MDKPDNLEGKLEIAFDVRHTVELNIEADKAEAVSLFHALPEDVLPPLPEGYHWARAKGKHSIVSARKAQDKEFNLIIYGPEAKKSNINFLFQVDGMTTYSLAHAKKTAKGPKRKFPMSGADYTVPAYNYSVWRYKAHVRGHLIDHQDTITRGSSSTWSTYDARNYIPEPPQYEWGMGFRRLKVKKIRERTGEGLYAQFNMYLEQPLKTVNGTPVPHEVRFWDLSKEKSVYSRLSLYHVWFEEDMTRPKGRPVLDFANTHFSTHPNAMPIVKAWRPGASVRGRRLQVRDSKQKELDAVQSGVRYPLSTFCLLSSSIAEMEFERIDHGLYAAERAYNFSGVEGCLGSTP